MNVFKKVYCRSFLVVAYVIKPFLPYHPPEVKSSIADIPAILKKHGKTRVLLVTDAVLRALGTTAELERLLKEAGIACAVYDGTCPNPTLTNVEEGLAIYNESSAQALIAFGGGSAMDCAKAIGARLARPKKPMVKMAGTLHVRGKIPLLIAIPTTAGTGSEATPAFVISDRAHGHKYTVNDFCLAPHYAILDPKVTLSLPPHLTATTGMDALTHAVETYTGRSTTRTTRTQSMEAVKLIMENIEKAYHNGQDYDARANMLYASFQAGKAFSMSYVGYVHAIAHSLGGKYNIPHGLANSVLLPLVLEGYGKPAHKKLAQLAVLCGIADESEPRDIAAGKFIARIRELNAIMNIPTTLKGIQKEDILQMAAYADREGNPLYPVPRLMDARELATYYEKVADWRTEHECSTAH